MLWFLMLYGVVTLLSGFIFYTRCRSLSDYVIGGRKIGTLFSIVSTQITLVGLLFSSHLPLILSEADGGLTVAVLAAVGIITGIFLDYTLVSRRLRIYSELSGQSKTFPEFLENRFDDKTGILRAISAAVILIFFALLASSLFGYMADVFSRVFAYERETVLFVIALFTGIYVFLGGLPAISIVDLIRALALLSFSVFVIVSVIDPEIFVSVEIDLQKELISAFSTDFFTEKGIFGGVLSLFSFAILFFGMPTVSHRYMAIKDRFKFGSFSIVSLLWLVPVAASSVILGVLTMAVSDERVSNFVELAEVLSKATPQSVGIALIIIFFAAIMSLVDSSVLIASQSISNDLFSKKTIVDKKKTNARELLSVNRVASVCITLVAAVFAMASKNSETSEFFSINFIITVISAAFGPVTLFSLHFENLTMKGALAAITSGISVSVFFKVADIIPPSLSPIEIIPAFLTGTIFLFAVSAFDRKKVSAKMLNEFGRTREISKMK